MGCGRLVRGGSEGCTGNDGGGEETAAGGGVEVEVVRGDAPERVVSGLGGAEDFLTVEGDPGCCVGLVSDAVVVLGCDLTDAE